MKLTKNIYIRLSLLFCGVFTLLLGGCSAESPLLPEDVALTFQLSLPGSLEVTTRAEPDKKLDEIIINNVWVVQYNANTGADDGTFIMAKMFANDAIGYRENNQTIKVTTSEFSNYQSRFYIIVNAGDTFLDAFKQETTSDRSESALQKLTMNITAGATDEPTLLTCGPLEYKPDKSQVVLVAPLQRAFARIKIAWKKTTDFEGKITMDEVKVMNLPEYMALYSRGGGSLATNYPETADINTDFTTIGTTALKEGEGRIFYMGENLRGTGTGSSFSDKGLEAKGPGGTLAGCTCLVLVGNYEYPNLTTDNPGKVKVEYRIYLGGNLMKDYNIQRGYEYQLTVNISGINSADVRVTITDGAVVVFDKVETITKEVDFR